MANLAAVYSFLPEFHDLLRESKKITHAFNVREGIANRFDPTHDDEHIKRVCARCVEIAPYGTHMRVVLIAAIFHDCCNYPKDHELRAMSSTASANAFKSLMGTSDGIGIIQLSWATIQEIVHVITSHSYSAKVKADTLEAQVLSDADKLDALGAIGIARCFAYAGMTGRYLYNPDNLNSDGIDNPSELNDLRYALDHFHTKLYKLPELMYTPGGLSHAMSAVAFMKQFERTLVEEVQLTGCGYLNSRYLSREWYSAFDDTPGVGQQIRKILSIFGCPTEGIMNRKIVPYGECRVMISLINPNTTRIHISGIPETVSPIPIDMDKELSLDLQMLILWINMAITFNSDMTALATCVARSPERYNEHLIIAYETQCARWEGSDIKFDHDYNKEGFDLMASFINQTYFKTF